MKKFLVLALALAACAQQGPAAGDKSQKAQCVGVYALTMKASCKDNACVMAKMKGNYAAIARKCGIQSVQELDSLYQDYKLAQSLAE